VVPSGTAMANAAGKDNDEQLEKGEPNGGGRHHVNVLARHFCDDVEAPVRVGVAELTRGLVAAGVGQAGGPVRAVVDATAVEGVLHPVPGLSDAFVARLVVVGHGHRHVLGDLSLDAVLEQVGGDATANFQEKDGDEEAGVSVNHTLVLK